MAALQAEQLWAQVYPRKPRPQLYASTKQDEDGFRTLTEPSKFMPDYTGLESDEMYAITSNNAIALQLAQQEYVRLMKQINYLKDPEDDKAVKNPQAIEAADVWEDKKEAALYGQKYIASKPAFINIGPTDRKAQALVSEQEQRDVTIRPNLFVQGGFVPNDRQTAKIIRHSTKEDRLNGIPDRFPLTEKNGKFYVPIQQEHVDEYSHQYANKLKPGADPDSAEAAEGSSVVPAGTPTPGVASLADALKRSTRFNGKKHPPTRDVSEAPSLSSTPKRKRPATPLEPETRESTPKRQRTGVNTNSTTNPAIYTNLDLAAPPVQPPKPKHPNQYTKAREREAAAQAAALAAAGGSLPPNTITTPTTTITPAPNYPDWKTFSMKELLDRKWKDDELRHCIKVRDDWLGPDDPKEIPKRRERLVAAPNPVRSFSMVKKWIEWKMEGKAARPRNKEKLAASRSASQEVE